LWTICVVNWKSEKVKLQQQKSWKKVAWQKIVAVSDLCLWGLEARAWNMKHTQKNVKIKNKDIQK